MFEKEILPFMEEMIMQKLRTYNVYSINEYEDIRKHGLEATVKIWKYFALIFIITTIVLTIRLFIQL